MSREQMFREQFPQRGKDFFLWLLLFLEWWWRRCLSFYDYCKYIQRAGAGSRKESFSTACFVVSWGSGCQQSMLTVAVLTQTLSRFWRWRECAFRGRAVTWKEAAKALAADEMWVRGSTKQKMLAEPGLSGSVGGGCRKKMRCFYMATSLCYGVRRGGSSPQAFEPAELYLGKEVRCSWFLDYSDQRLQSGNCLSCLLPMFWEDFLSHATWLQPVDIGSICCCVGALKLLPMAVSGYQEQYNCLRSSPNVGQLTCLTRTTWSGGEQYLEAVLLVVLDLPHPSLPSCASCWGFSYQRQQHVRGSAAWESALGVEDKQIK